MATDYGIRIMIDSALSADQKQEIVAKVMDVLQPHTTGTLGHNAAYAAGSATDQIEITITVF